MSTVPKFGSFRPKVAHVVEEATEGESLPREHKRERANAPSHSRSRSTHKSHAHHSRNLDDVPSTHRSKQHSQRVNSGLQRDAILREEAGESQTFIVDRRGDFKNVEYGSLHRYNISSYHRAGYGHLVGAPANIKIDREGSTLQTVVLSLSDQHSSRVNKPLLSGRSWPQQESKLRLIHAPSTTDVIDAQNDFIALRAIRKRKRSCSPSEQQATLEIDYRSINGKAKPSGVIADEDLEFASDHDLDDLATERELRARHVNAEFIRATKEHPNDANVWLALIKHQAKVIYPNTEATSLNSAEKRNLADVRLSLYDKALKHVRADNSGHNDLVLGFLREGSLIWEHSRLASNWMEALKHSPGSASLWTKYLDYVQTDHSNFTWEACKAVYIQCLSILRNAYLGVAANERHSVSKTQIYVFLRLTAYVRDAGYDELAYALWQLVLEKTFFRPADLSGPTVMLDALQDFWESEVTRIGEENAQGWAHQANYDDTGVRNVALARPGKPDAVRSMASFAQEELDMLNSLHLPATGDDDSTTDPFRHVMFSDVRGILEPLIDGIPHRELLNAFLVYMGFPMIPYDGDTCPEAAWEADQFLRTEIMTHDSNAWSCSAVASERHTTVSLFKHAFEGVHGRVDDTKSSGRDSVEFVDRVLERVVSASPQDDAIAEYHIAQRLQFFTGEATKTAKRLLKARPHSVRLYNAYALANAQQTEQVDKADDAWAMAISMAPSLGEEAADDVIMLWHSWIATKLQQGHAEDALRLILSMIDDDLHPRSAGRQEVTATASKKLKAVRYLENGWERMIYKHSYRNAILFAECHMWFDYLVAGSTLAAAVAVCAKYDTTLMGRGAPLAEEHLLQAQAGLCRTHLERHRPYRPALVRDVAAHCIRRFPQNSMFLNLYARVQPHFQVEDRIRASLRSDIMGSSEATIISWSYSIFEESRRCTAEAAGSMDHSIRSMFARALLEPSSTVSHSLTLWQMWLRFEHSRRYHSVQASRTCIEMQGKQTLQREKQVFLDGLRHLPWSKAWVILGLQTFVHEGGMHTRELQQIHDVLAERGLRVRAEME